MALAPLVWASKAPVEQLDYSVDLTAWLGDAGDTLLTIDASVTPNASPQDAAVLWASVMGSGATLFLVGGRPNVAYVVAVQIRTAAGRVALFDVGLQITADAAVAPAAIVSPLPMVLLDTGYSVLLLAPGVPLLLLPPNVLYDGAGTPLFLVAATPLLLA